eukprot:g8580.t1
MSLCSPCFTGNHLFISSQARPPPGRWCCCVIPEPDVFLCFCCFGLRPSRVRLPAVEAVRFVLWGSYPGSCCFDVCGAGSGAPFLLFRPRRFSNFKKLRYLIVIYIVQTVSVINTTSLDVKANAKVTFICDRGVTVSFKFSGVTAPSFVHGSGVCCNDSKIHFNGRR